MFFDRLGNHVTGEEPIVKEPIVESYYDLNRPVRPGFEKPQLVQEEVIEEFYVDETYDAYEDCDSIEESVENIVEYSEMDLDEMSDYIQEQVIMEATSRSLKEVKKHQQSQIKNKESTDISYIKKFARKFLNKQNNENDYLFYVNKSDCKNEDDVKAFEYLLNILKSNQPEKVIQNKFYKLLGMEQYKIDITELHLDSGFDENKIKIYFHYIAKNERVNLNGRILIHTSDVPNLDKTGLKPHSHNKQNSRQYGKKSVFFFAIKANDDKSALQILMRTGGKYGKYAYQYIPNGREDVFIDYLHSSNSDIKHHKSTILQVYIQTNHNLKCINVSDYFNNEDKTKAAREIDDYKEMLEDLMEQRDWAVNHGKSTEKIDMRIKKVADKIVKYQKILNESYISNDEFVPREIILEEKINAAERNELDDDDFGLVYTDEDGKKVRKYPLTDENHIRQAVRFFSHCPDEHKPHLARKILKKANEHDMDTSNWETIHEWAKK